MGVTVERVGEALQVRLTGSDRYLALKAELDVPWAKLTAIQAMDQNAVPYAESTWLRAPGGYLPGVFRHGSYGWKPNREFWAVWRQTRVLVIDVEDWDYRRLVLGVEHADGLANRLTA